MTCIAFEPMTDVLYRALDEPLGGLKDVDSTPRSNEPWSFGASCLTPSIMDPNSSSFSLLANQLPDYYTPTSAGITLYHHQAGDLHTPNYGLGLGTPLSMPTSDGPVPAGGLGTAFPNFQSHASQHLEQAPFDNVDPFHMQHVPPFPPHHFTHPTSFGATNEPSHDATIGEDGIHMDLNRTDLSRHSTSRTDRQFRAPTSRGTMRPPPTYANAEQYVTQISSGITSVDIF